MRHTAEVNPADSPEDSYLGFTHSVDVLATDGKRWRVAYLVTDEWGRTWRLAGRDGYTFEGVREWMELPPLTEENA